MRPSSMRSWTSAVERAYERSWSFRRASPRPEPEGRALEDQVVRTAESYGMALVGPNCMGIISSHHKLYATGFTLLRPDPGGASMVSQSGNLGHPAAGGGRSAQRGSGNVRRGRQRGDDRRGGLHQLPAHRPAHHDHRGLHGGVRRRPPVARRGPANVGGEAGGGAARGA